MGKLMLHSVYEQFRSDMFLSSLTESSMCRRSGGAFLCILILTSVCSDCATDGYVRG